MVNTPLLPIFQQPSSVMNNNNATNHEQTVDLAAAKLNALYDGGNVPRLAGPEKSRRSSQGYMHDSTSAARPLLTTAYMATMVILSLVNTSACPKYHSERRQWWRKPAEQRRQ